MPSNWFDDVLEATKTGNRVKKHSGKWDNQEIKETEAYLSSSINYQRLLVTGTLKVEGEDYLLFK